MSRAAVVFIGAAILLLLPATARAHGLGGGPAGVETTASFVVDLSGDSHAEEDGAFALGAFAVGRRGLNRYDVHRSPNTNWKLYGRFYMVNFANELGGDASPQFTWRRTGPRLQGRIYFGIQKRF